MPPLERTDRLQRAAYWEASGYDDYGRPLLLNPVELLVRWVDDDRDVLDDQGNTIALNATVIANQNLAVGSLMRLGTLAEALDNPGSYLEVKTFNATRDIKGRNLRRAAGLMRAGDRLGVPAPAVGVALTDTFTPVDSVADLWGAAAGTALDGRTITGGTWAALGGDWQVISQILQAGDLLDDPDTPDRLLLVDGGTADGYLSTSVETDYTHLQRAGLVLRYNPDDGSYLRVIQERSAVAGTVDAFKIAVEQVDAAGAVTRSHTALITPRNTGGGTSVTFLAVQLLGERLLVFSSGDDFHELVLDVGVSDFNTAETWYGLYSYGGLSDDDETQYTLARFRGGFHFAPDTNLVLDGAGHQNSLGRAWSVGPLGTRNWRLEKGRLKDWDQAGGETVVTECGSGDGLFEVTVCTQLMYGTPVFSASNTSPIVAALYSSAGGGAQEGYNPEFLPGQEVTFAGVAGNTAANGTFSVTPFDPDIWVLTGSTGNGASVGEVGSWLVPEPLWYRQGIVFRHRDSSNYLAAYLVFSGTVYTATASVRLVKVLDGVETVLAAGSFPAVNATRLVNGHRRLSVLCDGPSIKVAVREAALPLLTAPAWLEATCTDLLRATQAGLYQSSDTDYHPFGFDDFAHDPAGNLNAVVH